MTNLIGEYELALDAKGRFVLPSGFRKQLPETGSDKFVVTRGFETCLSLYTMDAWNVIAQKIASYEDFNPKVRDFRRVFMNGANIVELDSAGRLLLPKTLQEYAGLKKDIVFSAQGNKSELWDRQTYHDHMRRIAADFSSLAAEITGNSFTNPFA